MLNSDSLREPRTALLRGGDKAKADRYFNRAIMVFQRVEVNPDCFRERPTDLVCAIKRHRLGVFTNEVTIRAIRSIAALWKS